MGRLRIDVALALFAIIFVNCVVQSQYYLEQPTHIYVVDGPDSDGSMESVSGSRESQFMSRRGTSTEVCILVNESVYHYCLAILNNF